MSAKSKKRAQQAGAAFGGDPCAQVRRLMEKQNFKEAVREAKLCFRQQGSEESRRLLERAYFERARQLQKSGLTESAREVSGHLLEHGVTDPGILAELPGLLIAVGRTGEALQFQERVDSPQARQALVLKAADAAVLDPERAPASLPELKEGGRRVRSALDAVEAGDEARAFDELRAIARGSPFADWRFFVRGLAAYYRLDDTDMTANWSRLDPDRMPARVAGRLRALAGLSAPADAAGRLSDWAAHELRVFGEPVLAELEPVRDAAARQDWDAVLGRLGGLRGRLRRIDPILSGRLTSILYSTLLATSREMNYAECRRLVTKFSQALEAPPLDPRWNRLWAMIWENHHGDPREARKYWEAYIRDLERVEALTPDERRIAQAIAWQRVAQLVEDEDDPGDFPFLFQPRSRRSEEAMQAHVVQCLERSLELCPTHKPAYHQLFEAYRDWEQPEKAEAIARRLLERFPDDEEALRFLANRARDRDEPLEAIEYLRRVRALKPLDRGLVNEEWNLLLELARVHALNKRWAEGRAAFEAAERTRPEGRETLGYLARRGLFEHKAGCAPDGEALIERAKATLAEPTAAWLQLHAEAIRYRLNNLGKRFAIEWQAAQKAKPTSETAGAMARILGFYFQEEIKYSARDNHIKDAIKYIKNTRKLNYHPGDLRLVCEFLDADELDEAKLLETFVEKGKSAFPKAAFFHFMIAEIEIRKGPYLCNRPRAIKQLEEAHKLAQASSEPEDAELLPRIKERLTMLKEHSRRPFGPGPFGGGPRSGTQSSMPPEMEDFLDMMGHMGLDPDDDEFIFDDLDDDEDFEDDDTSPSPRRRPGPARGARKKKRRR
jgi:tetratricopeptide (TPR) repeat protein